MNVKQAGTKIRLDHRVAFVLSLEKQQRMRDFWGDFLFIPKEAY